MGVRRNKLRGDCAKSVAVLAFAAIAACGGSAETTTATAAPPATEQPPAAQPAPTTQPPAATQPAPTTSAPTTTTTVAESTTSVTVSAEQLATAAAVGDIAAGEELFDQPVAGVPHSVSCASCHSATSASSRSGPVLEGMAVVAGTRVDGMPAVDYLRQSIVDPYAFTVEGDWAIAMPYQYPDALSEEQINNLVAFLLTR